MNESRLTPQQLFQALEGSLPAGFPEGSWYIIVASCLISIGRSDVYGDLFTYLAGKTGTNRKPISARLRDVIIKSWTLVGMPKAIGASYSLQAVDPDGNTFNQGQRIAAISDIDTMQMRSRTWFRQVFGPNESAIFSRFKGHVDMEWTLRHIVYGIYIGELSHLSVVENEFLVATCVVTTGGPKSPSVSHLNALLLVGVTRAHVEVFEQLCERVSRWAGIDPSPWVRLRDVITEPPK